MNPLLTDKNAIVHGGGGSLGSVVARTFAAEGALTSQMVNATCGLVAR